MRDPRVLKLLKQWKREAPCPVCGRVTTQTLHGFTLDGKLWKGHVCLCGGWHCQVCNTVIEKRQECCR